MPTYLFYSKTSLKNWNITAHVSYLAALEDLEFQKRSVKHNLKWMSWFEKELRLLNLDFQSSITNFLLIKFY